MIVPHSRATQDFAALKTKGCLRHGNAAVESLSRRRRTLGVAKALPRIRGGANTGKMSQFRDPFRSPEPDWISSAESFEWHPRLSLHREGSYRSHRSNRRPA